MRAFPPPFRPFFPAGRSSVRLKEMFQSKANGYQIPFFRPGNVPETPVRPAETGFSFPVAPLPGRRERNQKESVSPVPPTWRPAFQAIRRTPPRALKAIPPGT